MVCKCGTLTIPCKSEPIILDALYTHLRLAVKELTEAPVVSSVSSFILTSMQSINGSSMSTNSSINKREFFGTLCVDYTSNPGILLDNPINLILVIFCYLFL